MLNRTDLLKRLDLLDEEAALLFDEDQRFRIILVGGSALVLLEYVIRSTHDIDALEAPRELAHIMRDYDIDLQVSAYVNNFPYNYEDRLVLLDIGGRRIHYFCLSLEDIVIAKLHGMRGPDIQDITNPTVLSAIDWKLLAQLKDEMRLSTLSEESESYRAFLYAYENYVSEYSA